MPIPAGGAPAEIAASALIKGREFVRVGEGRPLAPKEKAAADLYKKANEGKWREGLQNARLEKTTSSEQWGAKTQGKAEEIGTEVNDRGDKVRNGETKKRYETARKEGKLVSDYLEKGYTSLSDQEKTALRQKVARTVNSNPQLAREFQSLTPAEEKAYLEGMLTDSHHRELTEAQLRSVLERNEMVRSQDLGNEAEAAQTEVVEARGQLDIKKAELAEIDRGIKANENLLDDFHRGRKFGVNVNIRGVPVGGTYDSTGKKYEELRTLQAESPILKSKIATNERTIDAKNQRLSQLQTEKANATRRGGGGRPVNTIDNDIAAVTGEIKNLQKQNDQASEKLKRTTQLETEKQNLEEERKKLADQKKAAEAEVKKQEANTRIKEARLGSINKIQRVQDFELKVVREGQEEDLAGAFEGVMGRATDEYLNEEYQLLLKTYTEELDAEKAKTQDADEKTMYDAVHNRWLGGEKTRRSGVLWRKEQKYRPIDRSKVEKDFQTLMNPRLAEGGIDAGPEGVMRQMLLEQYGRTMPTGSDVNAKVTELMQNKAYMDKMQGQVVQNLVARKLLVSGVSQEDMYTIVSSQWGQDMMDKAYAQNAAFRAAVDKAQKEGILKGKTWMERWAQLNDKYPAALILFGIPTLIGALNNPQASAHDVTA